MATASRAPGEQTLSTAAARAMVLRGSRDEPGSTVPRTEGGPLQFTHDARLNAASAQRFTEDQMLAIVGSITAPVLLVRGDKGWPFTGDTLQKRVAVTRASAACFDFVEMQGSHHLHLDADTAPEVQGHVRAFLRRRVLSGDLSGSIEGAGTAPGTRGTGERTSGAVHSSATVSVDATANSGGDSKRGMHSQSAACRQCASVASASRTSGTACRCASGCATRTASTVATTNPSLAVRSRL